MGSNREFLNNLQALRAYAAGAVVSVHLAQACGFRSPFGLYGVDVFFVLSGFIMAMLATREPAQFFARRLIRIVPLYWLCTFGVFFVALLKPGLLHTTRPDLGNLLKSLFFIPYRKESGAVFPLLFLGWTLNYEIFFYMLFGAVLRLKLPRPSLWVSLVIVALPVLGALFPSTSVLWGFYTHPMVLEFLLGIAVFHLTLKAGAGTPRRWSLVLIMACAMLLMPCMEVRFGVAHRELLLGLPAVVMVLCAVRLERVGCVVRNRLVLLIGNASYVLYLTHPYVLQFGEKAFGLDRVASLAGRALLATLLVTLALAVACATHIYFEIPVMRLLKRLLLSRNDRTIPAVKCPVSVARP
jgi:peptidoglycan/LPS O-acetylase OafA/YrhL